MERSNVLITKRKKSEFSLEGLIQDLNRLLSFEEGHIKDANALPEVKFSEACMALNALIKYLDLISDQKNYEKFSFKRLDSLRYVHLDSAAMNALHVLPKKEGLTVKNQSILGLLDRCRTPHGKR
jgi:DNA mismatch repair protein MSH2